MNLFHRHTWNRAMVTHAPVAGEYEEIRGQVPWSFLTMVHGVTTVLYECTDPKCGATKTVEMLGKKVEE